MKRNIQSKLEDYEGRYDFRASEWKGLEARLNQHSAWRRGLLTWLGGLLLLGLVGSNIALWQQNKALTQRLSTVDFDTSKAETITVLGQNDTVFKHVVIYQNDTIYRTTTVMEQPILASKINDKSLQKEAIFSTVTAAVLNPNPIGNALENSQNKSGNSESTPPQYKSDILTQNIENSRILVSKDILNRQNDSLIEEGNNAKKPALAVVDSTALQAGKVVENALKKDSITAKSLPIDGLEIVKKDADKTVKKYPKYTFKMLPMYVGASVGLPLLTYKSDLSFNANQYGLKTEIVATDRVRFWGEINFSENGESKSTSFQTLPNEIKPPTVEPSSTLKYWEVDDLQSLNYLLGVQYHFGKHETFHPYVAAAFNGTTVLPFEVNFEYHNPTTGMERSYKQSISQNITHFNRIYGAIGVHWDVFRRVQLSTEAYFNTAFTSDKALMPTQVGLKMGVSYLFK